MWEELMRIGKSTHTLRADTRAQVCNQHGALERVMHSRDFLPMTVHGTEAVSIGRQG